MCCVVSSHKGQSPNVALENSSLSSGTWSQGVWQTGCSVKQEQTWSLPPFRWRGTSQGAREWCNQHFQVTGAADEDHVLWTTTCCRRADVKIFSPNPLEWLLLFVKPSDEMIQMPDFQPHAPTPSNPKSPPGTSWMGQLPSSADTHHFLSWREAGVIISTTF